MRLCGVGSWIPSLFRHAIAVSLVVFWTAFAASCDPVGGRKPVKEVRVQAGQFEFEPARIEMERDTTLRLIITSRDVVHGLNIIGTDLNVLVPAGGEDEASLTFEPEKPGEYRFKCSKVCGPGHLLMRGVIVVR